MSEQIIADNNAQSGSVDNGNGQGATNPKAEKRKRRRQKLKELKKAAVNTQPAVAEKPKNKSYADRQEEIRQRRLANMTNAVSRQDGEKPAILVASNKASVLKLSSLLIQLERCEDAATTRLTRAYKSGNAEVITSLLGKPAEVKEALDTVTDTLQKMIDKVYLAEGFGGPREIKPALKRLGLAGEGATDEIPASQSENATDASVKEKKSVKKAPTV